MTATKKFSFSDFYSRFGTVILLVVLIIIASIMSPVFFTAGNIFNVLRQQVPYLFIGMGIFLCILTGGIDLSSGSVIAVANCLVALLTSKMGWVSGGKVVLAIVLSILIGLAFGALNGTLVAYLKLAPFIATLATMQIARGIAQIITGGSPIRFVEEPAVMAFSDFFNTIYL